MLEKLLTRAKGYAIAGGLYIASALSSYGADLNAVNTDNIAFQTHVGIYETTNDLEVITSSSRYTYTGKTVDNEDAGPIDDLFSSAIDAGSSQSDNQLYLLKSDGTIELWNTSTNSSDATYTLPALGANEAYGGISGYVPLDGGSLVVTINDTSASELKFMKSYDLGDDVYRQSWDVSSGNYAMSTGASFYQTNATVSSWSDIMGASGASGSVQTFDMGDGSLNYNKTISGSGSNDIEFGTFGSKMYSVTSGGDLDEYTVTPEPSTWFGISCLVSLICWHERKRLKKGYNFVKEKYFPK